MYPLQVFISRFGISLLCPLIQDGKQRVELLQERYFFFCPGLEENSLYNYLKGS